MGITVDEAITCLSIECKGCQMECRPNEAYDMAINTMKKYQKIKQIHKQWFCDFGSADAYTKIGDVLKNGNDD